jgi:hypothetical protein
VAPTETCSTGAVFYPPGQAMRSAVLDNAARQSQTMPIVHHARFLALAGVCMFLTSLALAVVRPGEFGGRYICELLASLPDSSAR